MMTKPRMNLRNPLCHNKGYDRKEMLLSIIIIIVIVIIIVDVTQFASKQDQANHKEKHR